MLILTRKCREMLVVSGADCCSILVKVVVLEIKKGKVRLGIEAAADVPVDRFEVWERLRRAALANVPREDAIV